jgi:hypothetical protein
MVFDFYQIKCLSRTFLHSTPRNALELTLLLRCIWSLRGYNLDFEPSRAQNVVAIKISCRGARYYLHETQGAWRRLPVLQF